MRLRDTGGTRIIDTCDNEIEYIQRGPLYIFSRNCQLDAIDCIEELIKRLNGWYSPL